MNNKSSGILANHILPTSSNLLGICFLIYSLIKVSGHSSTTLLDEFIIIPIVLFFTSSFLSYFSIRTSSVRLEKCADICFIASLGILALVSVGFMVESIGI